MMSIPATVNHIFHPHQHPRECHNLSLVQLSFKIFILISAIVTVSLAEEIPNLKTTKVGLARLNTARYIQTSGDVVDWKDDCDGEGTFDLPLHHQFDDATGNENEINVLRTHFPSFQNFGGIHDSLRVGNDILTPNTISQDLNPTIDNEEMQLVIQIEQQKFSRENLSAQSYEEKGKDRIKNKNFIALKTGTTIVGVKTSDTIVLAADTRATEGSVVADILCEKVHQISQNIWCCGAGTSADLDALTRKVRYTFLLKTMIQESVGNNGCSESFTHLSSIGSRKREIFVSEEEKDIGNNLGIASISAVCDLMREELYRNGGEIGANLVLGGFDQHTNQPILTAIHPHGSIDVVPYTALGSGGLAAMGVLESRYRLDLSVEEAVQLVKEAVKAGIHNDLGSGSQIDVCIINQNGTKYLRGVIPEEKLILSDGDDKMDNKLFKILTGDKKIKSMDGVNGFGSLPYTIKNREILLEDEKIIDERHEKWLTEIINS
mmetsp:Transcript_15322/g.18648  ORF Transcript_15322/g.18648 Transcript_15322/m.18648 type:complete len:491 (+) Transcript_15322:77-1549(+)